MKNELGIEVCCKNCFCISDKYKNHCIRKDAGKYCKKNNFKQFSQSWEAMEARIKELQEQQFTEAELNTLKDILQDYFRVYTTQHYRTQPLLNKVEQILKNLEGNLNESKNNEQ